MASNLKWYHSLSKKEKDDLNEKRRIGGLKGSKTAKENNRKRKQYRLKNILLLDWNELTKNEKRIRILKEQEEKCFECGVIEEWNGKPLKFDLDHIDGDKTNDNRINLRLICPNCHSQTSTYKVGNNKQPGKIVYTDEMIIDALKKSSSIYVAIKSIGMNPHGGNYTRIRKIIKKYDLNLSYLLI